MSLSSGNRPVRIGLIGCGMISEFQSEAIRQVPHAEIAGYYDMVAERAQARSARYGGKVYKDLEDMLRDPGVTAVSICTPSGLHLEPAVAAAKAGKHIMVEKPIEITPERADAIIDACRQAGITLGAIFPRRFHDSSQAVKAAVGAGRFGTLVLADVAIKWWRSQKYYDEGGWKGTWKLDGGGALMNQGIHGIDLLQWLMGGIDSVVGFTATRAHQRIEVEDAAAAAVRFKNGALGSIEGTTGAWPGTKIRTEICGSAGSIALEDEVILSWKFEKELPEDEEIRRKFGPRAGLSGGGASDPKAIDCEGHRRQFADFVESIRAGRKPRVDGAEARQAVAIIAAIYRSAREGRAVKVD
ncbi:MAG: Gfo/Idh/MocA family oxidoreductase [Planctomycetes bacterium]|nr:Gfo/Idh/MocA family oxidoreductase [Planctomycetota bacterium]